MNLINLYYLRTTKKSINKYLIYLYELEQLKLYNLSYINEYEQKRFNLEFFCC